MKAVRNITYNSSPDEFITSIEEVLNTFDDLSPIYVVHYKKNPSITDSALLKLESLTKNPQLILKEVSNSISAGIFISHGHSSIYGSDVHNWDEYKKISNSLPELRLPVGSFEQFCLLLKKDKSTINTLLDEKNSEEIILHPFSDDTSIKLKIYNDINVFFGPKGSGKTFILKSIEKHYTDLGVYAKIYRSASDRLEEIFDIKNKNLTIQVDSQKIQKCSDEIEKIKNAKEIYIPSTSKYIDHFRQMCSNKNAKKILLKDIHQMPTETLKKVFVDYNNAEKTVSNFLFFLKDDPTINKEISKKHYNTISSKLTNLQSKLQLKKYIFFSHWKETTLLNSASEKIRKEVHRKTGTPTLPSSTGFREYARNRIMIERCISKIIKTIEEIIPIETKVIGNLGEHKGMLCIHTQLIFHNGTIRDSNFSRLIGSSKNLQKEAVQNLRKIYEHIYQEDLFQCISNFNEIENIEEVKSTHDLLLFSRYFAIDGQKYSPSSGESAMIMLQKELENNKDIFILDEPERSLGNDYINDIIVPMIKDLARLNKKIFIATHDANIAVRTLPYCSIYRCHEKTGYKTYCGNPFINNLININNDAEVLDWKSISMKTLEGGEEAFGERGQIYGKI